MKVNRDRIKEQSKQVAEYMKKPKKYQVLWTCPHCGNSHTWWWEDEFEAFDDSVVDMKCDRCDEVTKCQGDGHGYYEPIAESTSVEQRTLEQINAALDGLQASRLNHFSMLVKLSAKDDELDDLNTDLHNYVRQIEDKLSRINEDNKAAFDAINTLAKRLSTLEIKQESSVIKYQPGDTHLDDDGVMRVYTGKEWLQVQQNIELELK